MDVPVSTLITHYSHMFHREHAGQPGATSPVGAWLLLALIAPTTSGVTRVEIETVLGTSAEEANAAARELIANPHPALATALAAWSRPDVLTDKFVSWENELRHIVHVAEMPSAEDAAIWAQEHTAGLVKAFPSAISRSTAVLFQNSLAARTSWVRPFSAVAPDHLGGQFGKLVASALESAHHQFIAETNAAGLVGAHVAKTREGLSVVSVIADENTPSSAVLQAAHEVVDLLNGDNTGAQRISLFDLPAGPGAAWFIDDESPDDTRETEGVVETVEAFLPAWKETSSTHPLNAPGFQQAAQHLAEFIDPAYRPMEVEARQDATASFTQHGHEAVTMIAASSSVPYTADAPANVLKRTATIRFNRPYAAVGYVRPVTSLTAEAPGSPVWECVPVFSAWIDATSLIADEATRTHGPADAGTVRGRPLASLATRRSRRNLWRIAIGRLNEDPSVCAHAASELFAVLGIGFDAGLGFVIDACSDFFVTWGDSIGENPARLADESLERWSQELSPAAIAVLRTTCENLHAQEPASAGRDPWPPEHSLLAVADWHHTNVLHGAIANAAETFDTTTAMGAYVPAADLLVKLAWERSAADAEQMATFFKSVIALPS